MSGVTVIESEHQARLVVDIYSHHFSVKRILDKDLKMMLDFCRPMGQMGLKRVGRGKFIKAIVRVFAVASKDRREFRFHISQLDDFYYHCRNYSVNKKYITIRQHELFEPTRINLYYHDPRIPRNYQKPVIEYIVSEGNSKVIELDPGKGKTFIALKAIDILKVRTFFCIKSKYIDKWIEDAHEAFDLQKEDLMVVRGSSSLVQLLRLAKEGMLNAKIILCSNTTFGIFLKEYEAMGEYITEHKWPCLPHEMWELLGIGLNIVDEAHEFLHFNYKMRLYTNVAKTLDLSGTLISNDAFVKRILETLHPLENRFFEKERIPHANAQAIFYDIFNVQKRAKYINPTINAYSHSRFEKSIMSNNKLLNGYLDMIFDIIERDFIDVRKEGQKMAVYFATKKMCTLAHHELEKRHKHISVRRYIGEDDYEATRKGDLIITTLKSMGTAIDVPGLVRLLMTDSLGSLQGNIQVLGRLRPIKDYPDQDPVFTYLVCKSIDKQMNYHREKLEMFKGRVKEHTLFDTNVVI